MRRWDGLLDRYMQILQSRGVSQSYLNAVRSELERFGLWIKRKRPRPSLEVLDSEMIISYLKARGTFKSKATVYGIISRLRGMGDFLSNEGFWKKNPLRWIKGPRLDSRSRVPRRIGKRSLEKLLESASSSRERYYRYLWIAVVVLMYGTGMRRGELERLDVCDWDRSEGTIRVDGRKTGRERVITVPDISSRCLEAYLPYRQLQLEKRFRQDEDALFVNKRGERLRGAHVSHAVHLLAKKAGMPLVSLHQFRHTCASDLMEAGEKLVLVQKILGHATISTTMRYTHVAEPQRRQAMERHPINHILSVKEFGQC